MAITTQTLEPDTFARKVIEDRLEVRGPIRGYLYAARSGQKDDVLYRTYASKKWVYQSRIVYQQTNVAGGVITADYAVASGQLARIISVKALNSGNNGIVVVVNDEDNAEHSMRLVSVAAGGGTYGGVPNIGAAGSTSAHLMDSLGFVLAPGQKLTISQTAAGVQNDTLTVAMTLELYNLPTLPTISVARSTNPGDVTQAASTISETNTLQEFPC